MPFFVNLTPPVAKAGAYKIRVGDRFVAESCGMIGGVFEKDDALIFDEDFARSKGPAFAEIFPGTVVIVAPADSYLMQ